MKVRTCTYCGAARVFDLWPAGSIACCEKDECCKAYDRDYNGGARLDLTDCQYSATCSNVAVVAIDMGPVGREVKCCRKHADFYERMSV